MVLHAKLFIALLLGFVLLIPMSAGYLLAGIPQYIRYPQNHYLIWLSAFVNIVLLIVTWAVTTKLDLPRRILIVMFMIMSLAYFVGFGYAVHLLMHGQAVFPIH